MSLRARLLVAQVPLAVSLVVVAVVATKGVGALDKSSQAILQDNNKSIVAVQNMRDAVLQLARAARQHDKSERDKLRAIADHQLDIQEHNITEAGEREKTAELRSTWTQLGAALDALMTAENTERRWLDIAPLADAFESAAQGVIAINQDAILRKSRQAQADAARIDTVLVGVSIAALLLGLAATAILTARLTRPLAVLATAVRRLGEGDLAARLRGIDEGHDELADIARELNTMAERLAAYKSSSLGELLAAQQSAQSAMDSLPDPVIVCDGPLLVAANHAASQLFAITIEDGLERAPAEVRILVDKVKEQAASGRGAYAPRGLDEAVPIKVDGGQRHFLVRASPVAGRPGVVTLLFQDVSRLRRLDELKTDLVATAAHELRTPLTSLRMAVHLLAEGTVGGLTDKQADLLQAAREDLERLQSTVDDLLDLSRIQSGRIEIQPRPTSSRALLGRALDDAEPGSISLTVDDDAVDRLVVADPERIQLALGNLVGNALRHARHRVRLRASSEAKAVRFAVEDDGSGIPAEHIPRLFERFTRVPGGVPGGAGLGLYICKEIISAHGGQIGVDSHPPRGTTFFFTLPLAKQES
jgi:signal transduction histidine kinase